MRKTPTILDYYVALYQRRWRLILNFFAVGVVAAALSFALPKWYKATTTILPPSADLGGLPLSALQSRLPFSAFGLLGSDQTMSFVAILESKSVMESVARKFSLTDLYQKEHIQETVKALRQNVDVNVTPEGTITIDVLDKDPIRSAEMANAFAFYLDSLNTVIKTEKARNDRIFIERRFTQNQEDLEKAEEEMQFFQESYGAISLPVQTEAAVRAAAELEAEIIAMEVELAVQEKYLSKNHETLINLRNRVDELRNKRESLAIGDPAQSSNGDHNFDLFIPFADLPEIAVRYARHFRELEVQNTLFKLLLEQYEMARLQESRETPTVQVLDSADPPYRKAKPMRALIAVLSALSTTIVLSLLVLANVKLTFLRERDSAAFQKLVSHIPLNRFWFKT